MLQRIQTVYLLFAVLCYTAMFILPIRTAFTNDSTGVNEPIMYLYHNGVLSILAGLGILVALITIFLYGNRRVQAMLALLGAFNALGLLALIGLGMSQHPENIDHWGLGVIMPLLALVFSLLAFRGIKRDDKLVRSADRLR